MGWTAPRTFVTAEIETAAIFNTHLRDNLLALNGYVRKTADESVTSSAVLQNDNELLLSIGATGTYVFDVILIATSAANAAGDLAVGFTFPTGTLHLIGQGPDIGLASGNVQTGQWGAGLSIASGATFNGYGLSTNNVGIWLHGILIATATGTLTLQWAQNASNASASTVKAGSHMIMKQTA